MPLPQATTAANRCGLRLKWDTRTTTQFSYEWISAPAAPPNIYADFLKKHTEGIQHLGMPVDDLNQAVAAYEKLGYHVWQSGAWGDVGKKELRRVRLHGYRLYWRRERGVHPRL